jgi:hypothetical protein
MNPNLKGSEFTGTTGLYLAGYHPVAIVCNHVVDFSGC